MVTKVTKDGFRKPYSGPGPKTPETTNRKFAETNAAFYKACRAVGIPPTTRQASEFRRGLGTAYKTL